MKTYFKSVSNLLKIWFYFMCELDVSLVGKASETQYYKLYNEGRKPNLGSCSSVLLSLAVLGFVCVLVFCEPFLFHFDASLGLCVLLSCKHNCL